MEDIYVYPYTGLGDSIYQRPFIRALAARHRYVYYRTPWPELVCDFENVLPVKPDKDYRTQVENVNRSGVKWHEVPKEMRRFPFMIGYDGYDLTQFGIIKAYERTILLRDTPFIFDVPKKFNKNPIDSKGKPIAVVRPPTLRREWLVPARNTKAEYIDYCARELQRRGYFVVSLAHLKPKQEWLTGKITCDLACHNGELKVPDLIGLLRHTSIVVGNSGWIIPMAAATKTPLFIVWGGRGAFDNHHSTLDPRLDMSKIGWAYPDNFCLCGEDLHLCNKDISKLPKIFDLFLEKINDKHTIAA